MLRMQDKPYIMRQLKGKVAVVTGAGAGIGRALSLELLSEGMHVALLDISEKHLAETAPLVKGFAGKATFHQVDISDRMAVKEIADEVFERFGRVDILVNNAGVCIEWAPIAHISWTDWEWVMNTNFWGPLHCFKYFFPYLMKQEEAHMVNVSSILSVIGSGERSAYCASKFAFRGITECMHQELQGSKLRITLVLPGGVGTDFILNSNPWKNPEKQKSVAALGRRLALKTPEQVAKQIVWAVKKNKKRLVIGVDAKFLDHLARYFPVLSNQIMPFMVSRMEEKLA